MRIEELPDGSVVIRKQLGAQFLRGILSIFYLLFSVAIGWALVGGLLSPIRSEPLMDMVPAAFGFLAVTYLGLSNLLQALDDQDRSVRVVGNSIFIDNRELPRDHIRGVVHERVPVKLSMSNKVDIRFVDGRRQVLAWYVRKEDAEKLVSLLARKLDLPVARREVASTHAHLFIDRLLDWLMRLFRTS